MLGDFCCSDFFKPRVEGIFMTSSWRPVNRPVTCSRAANGAMALAITFMLLAFASESLQALTLTALHVFNAPPDGGSPWAAPIQDKLGNFYGTTWAGGTKSWGTVYKVDS